MMTMSSREKAAVAAASSSEQMEWSAEEEIQLFCALEGLKPVGVNKHFYMFCISDRLSKSLNRAVPAEAIWSHLRTMYNLDVLDELEPLPFPNEEKEFSLPDEYAALLSKKQAESEEKEKRSSVERATSETPKEKAISSLRTNTATTQPSKEVEKKIAAKAVEIPKRAPKRTRGSMSLESNSSPSTTPPPIQSNKRRRI